MDSTNKEEALRLKVVQGSSHGNRLYRSQHAGVQDYYVMNNMFDLMHVEGIIDMAPMYKSGVNPNFFDEYFTDLDESDITNSGECRTALWNEYQRRRWSYAVHLTGYHQGSTQETNRKLTTVELWRRLRGRPTTSIVHWYFAKKRELGDILKSHTVLQYTQGVSLLHSQFANCPVPPAQILKFGSVHVAVGFVDLGILLDSNFVEAEDKKSTKALILRGIEASSFSVAKSLVLWEMMRDVTMKSNWVVQVWFSSVWSKGATKAFLAATSRITDIFECEDTYSCYPVEVISLVKHWSRSKGVGLKKLIKRRSQTRKESSYAMFFARKEDRVEMIRYHLTGMFGVINEDPCSSSITMFDCPRTTHENEAACVFHTLTLHDIASSEHFNGSYFQTAEKVKECRVDKLMGYIQAEKIKISLTVNSLSLSSVEQILEISSLQPLSMSWSNVLDYMSRDDFHNLAKQCAPNANHSGYSMNWPTVTFGASLIDYPDTSLDVIRKAQNATDASMRKIFGQRKVFLTPIQNNPLNITHSYLAHQCYSHWVKYFFNAENVELLDSTIMDATGNPLSRTMGGVVSCSWTYT